MIKQEVKKKEFSHENNSHLLLVGGVALLFRSFYAIAQAFIGGCSRNSADSCLE
jgi:hypothetical protein